MTQKLDDLIWLQFDNWRPQPTRLHHGYSASKLFPVGYPRIICLENHYLTREFMKNMGLMDILMPLGSHVDEDFLKQVEKKRPDCEENSFLPTAQYFALFDGKQERTARVVQYFRITEMSTSGGEFLEFDKWRHKYYDSKY